MSLGKLDKRMLIGNTGSSSKGWEGVGQSCFFSFPIHDSKIKNLD